MNIFFSQLLSQLFFLSSEERKGARPQSNCGAGFPGETMLPAGDWQLSSQQEFQHLTLLRKNRTTEKKVKYLLLRTALVAAWFWTHLSSRVLS